MTIPCQGGFALGTALLSLTLALDVGPVDRFAVLFPVCAPIAGPGGAFTFVLVQTKG